MGGGGKSNKNLHVGSGKKPSSIFKQWELAAKRNADPIIRNALFTGIMISNIVYFHLV